MWLQTSTSDRGKRLDHFLRERLPQYTRSRLQQWIDQGRVEVDGAAGRSSSILKGSERIHVEPAELPALRAVPEEIPLDILYEDADVIAINKPAGMVVHSGAGRHTGTLVNALLHRFGNLSQVGGPVRPGIVHRLDRLTSGVLLIARNDAAHQHLARQFSSREVEKIYLALVHGSLKADQGRITAPITRDLRQRVRMTAKLAHGRSAITEYRVLKRFEKFTFLEVKIGTGRTHQIRVHLASIGHPVVGDKLYGAPASTLGRYFLHAHRITFTSRASGDRITITAPLPAELQQYLDGLGPAAASRRQL